MIDRSKIVCSIAHICVIVLVLTGPLSGVKTGYIPTLLGRIWYRLTSPYTPGRIPLIAVHGGPGSSHKNLRVLEKLDRPVILYDQRGCGNSGSHDPESDADLELSRFTNEINILANKLGLKKFHLLGQSFGGAIAAKYALKHPEKVAGLVLSSPMLSAPQWQKDTHVRLQSLSPCILLNALGYLHHGTIFSDGYHKIERIFEKNFVCRNAKMLAKLKCSNSEMYWRMWGPNEFTITGTLEHFDCINQLEELHMPTLVTGGKFDEILPETFHRIFDTLPAHNENKLVIFKNSAHAAHLEETKLYLEIVDEFLAEIDAQLGT